MMARPIEIPAASQYRFHVDHLAGDTGSTRHLEPLIPVKPGQGSVDRDSPGHHDRGPSDPPTSTCIHRQLCCRCVCDLTGFVHERGCQCSKLCSRGVFLVAGVVRHRVPPRYLGHVTHCVEAPLARSWPVLVFSAPMRGSGVALVMRLWFGGFVVSGPATTSDAIRIAASGRVSTATDASGRCRVHGIDVTALSPKCQQPSRQSVKNPVIRVSEEQQEGR